MISRGHCSSEASAAAAAAAAAAAPFILQRSLGSSLEGALLHIMAVRAQRQRKQPKGRSPHPVTSNQVSLLSVAKNALLGSLPDAIRGLSRVKCLDVGNNTLKGNIPRAIALLTHITWLGMDNNMFGGSIPHALVSLQCLEDLDARANQLKGSIANTMISTMSRLRLDCNLLVDRIPSAIARIQRLNVLTAGRPAESE